MKVNQTNNKTEILDAYKEEVKKNEDLAKMMAELLERVKNLETTPKSVVETVSTTPTGLNNNRMIKVINMYDGKLNLKTRADGNGAIFTFIGFGQTRSIAYNDLVDIVQNNWSFFEKGYAYVDDEDFVKSNNLTDAYEKILDKDTLSSLLEIGVAPMLTMVEKMPKSQLEVLVGLIVNRLAKGENLDLNKVYKISAIYGRDILEMVKDVQFLELDKK